MSGQTRRTFIRRGAAAGTAIAAGGVLVPGGGAFGRTAPKAGRGIWLPGDLHTHSTYSHDVYGGPTDDNTGPDEAYTLGLPVAGKFLEGRERGGCLMAVSPPKHVPPGPPLSRADQGAIAIPAFEQSV